MLSDWIERFYKNPWLLLFLRLVLGSIFLVAGAGKLSHGSELLGIITGYGLLPESLAYAYASSLPLMEIAIGFLLILGLFPRLISSFSIVLTASFITANVYSLLTGTSIGSMCGCFGEIIPLTHIQSLALNFIMLSIALFLVFRHSSLFSIYSTFTAVLRPRTGTAVLLVGLLLFMSFPVPTAVANNAGNEIVPVADTDVNTIEFNKYAESSRIEENTRPAILYFYNDQCHNCQQQKPIIDALEDEYGDGLVIERIDSHDNMALLREYNITAVPAMIVFNGSQANGENSYNKYVGYTNGDILRESLDSPAVAPSDLQSQNVRNVPLSVSGMSIEPDGNQDEPVSASFVTPDDVITAVSNMVAPYGQILLWASGNTFGPNAGITIDWGTILAASCGADGIDDWIYPYSDIYIVPAGSVSVGDTLVDAGGSKNTVWGASGGIFINATIGYTSPGGNVGPGTYAVVYDECQNGKLDDIDALFDPAFEVVIPADVPPMPASFAAVKVAAAQQAAYHLNLKGRLKVIFDDLHAMEQAAAIPACVANPAACLLKYTLKKIKENICSSLGIGMNAEKETLGFVGNMAGYYLGIAADPPDPNYRELTPLAPIDGVDAQSNDPILLATANLTNSLMTEGALAEAFLTSVERYQGAGISSDGEWALIHARAIRNNADALAYQLALTNGAIASLDATLAADTRPFDDMVTTLDDFQSRMEESGFTDNETMYLLNLGLSEEEIDELAAEIAGLDFEDFSKASFSAYLAGLSAANADAIASLGTFVSDMESIITTLLADEYVFQLRPQADAGGPYATDEGTPLTLDGAGSSDPDGSITAWDWDLDRDGEFDDASGASPSVTFDHDFNGMVGLRVTDDEGRTGIDYAFIAVANVNSPPSIDTYSPTSPTQDLELGNTLGFSVTTSDPDGDTVTVQWTVDGTPAATGNSFSYEPIDTSELGMRIIQVQVSDDSPLGGTVTRTWGVSVLAVDADSDGWRVNLDCDDTNPDINPGMTEIIGNGKDDDCNIMTGDMPPVAAFSYSPPSPMAGEDVYFTDESTDSDGSVIAWAWDFGDGATSDLQDPVHSYSGGGSFMVTLTVTDDTGGVESASQIINILSPPEAAFTTGKAMNVAALGDGASIIDYSSVYNTNTSYRPENAIDGSTSTRWQTANGQPTDQWLKIDLSGDAAHIVNHVILRSTGGTSSIKDFEIRVSNGGTDDTDFTTVLTGTVPQASGLYEYDFTPVAAKYVQLYVVDNWGYASYTVVSHFEVLTQEREGGIVSLLEGLPPTIAGYSSQSSDSFSPEKMLDETGSYWQTATDQTTDQWAKVELGGGYSYIIERVILKAPYVNYAIQDFEIRVSNTTADDAAFTTVFSGTATNDTELQEFSFTPVEARYVQLFIINNYGGGTIRVSNLRVLTPDRSNIARLSGVGAFVVGYSSQYNDAYSAEKAIDFSTTSYWQTATGQSSNQWFKVRLIPGAPYLIDRVKFKNNGSGSVPRDFEIRVSNTTIDDAAFVPVYSGTLPQDTAPHWAVFPAVEARYVQLYIFNNHGGATVRVDNFRVYSPQLGGAVVPFIDLSDDESGIVSWSWDFGDGVTSAEQHPLHTYAAPGTYTVTLTTTDSDGLSDVTAMDYTVLQSPSADFTWTPTVPDEGQNTKFTDTSTDVDGLVLGWLWQFPHITTQYTSYNPSTSFPDNGDYDVTLTVTDSQLLTSTTTQTVTALNAPPYVNAGSDRTVFWGQDWAARLPEYTPLNSSVSDQGLADRDSLIVDWDFGDGETIQVINAISTTMRVSHSYAIPGIYLATANVTDKDGGTDTNNLTVTVNKRGTIQKLYPTLTSNNGKEIKAATKLWDTFDLKQVIEGRTVTFTLGSQTATAVTDSDGYAIAFLTGDEGDTVTASFAGDDYYEASSATDIVGAAPALPVGDIIFIIDESGSMGVDIADVKANVANIANQLGASVDYQLALVGFGAGSANHWMDVFPGTPLQITDGLPHIHSPLSDNLSDFDNALDYLIASGGIEPGFSAVTLATSPAMGYFRTECASCVIVITDERAETNITETSPETKEDAIAALEARNAIFLGVINPLYGSPDDYGPNPGSLADATGGEVFDIMDFRADPEPVLVAILDKCVQRIIQESSANLSISKIANPEPVLVGDNLTYTLEITNHGPADAIGVTVIDILSENVTFVSAVSSQGSCSESSGNVTCDLDTLVVGATATVTITVVPTVEGSVINLVSVASDRYDPDESNNIATVTSTVGPANSPPELDPIGDRTVDEGVLLEFTVTADDPDDDLLEFLASNLPSGATFDTLNQIFSWTPDFNQSGSYPDVYFKVSDGVLSDSENITITVNNVNRAPLAADDAYSTDENTNLDVAAPGVLDNDSDADNDPLTAILVDDVTNGALSLNADGSFSYAPTTDYSGTDSFTYKANDGTDNSSVATATITVRFVNVPPIAADDTYSTDENTTLNVAAPGVLDNDSDADNDPLTAILVDDVTNGALTLNSDGSFSYAPTTDYSGTDSFTYKANDGTDNSSVATATITVRFVNVPPIAADDTYSTDENTTLNVAAPGVLDNDSDADNDPLTAILVDDVTYGALTLNSDGSFGYEPDTDYTGTDSFTYKANDGTDDSTAATVTITVNAGNVPPVAIEDAYGTDENTSLVVAAPGVLGNDSDADADPLTAILVDDVTYGALTLNADGSFSYSPAAGYSGSDSFTYKANDGTDNSNIATVTIEVNHVNKPPVADADGPYWIDVGDDLSLDGTGSVDPDAAYGDSIVSYEWDLGDDGSYEGVGRAVTLPWANLASLPQPNVAIPIRLRVTDSFGVSATDTTELIIFINEPMAAFTANPNPAAPTQTITFDASASSHSHPDHNIVLYEWDFDDDGTFDASSATPVITHSYSYFGSYTATLRVTDDNEPMKTDLASRTILVSLGNRPPIADADGPYTVDEGSDLVVDASGSSDPDAAYGDSIVSYEWDLDDDDEYDDASGVTATIVFNDNGFYTVGLRVTDSYGESDTATTSVTVLDLSPTAVLTGDTILDEGLAGSYDASGSTSYPDAIVLYEWDGNYNSSTFNPSGDTGVAQSHTWNTDGIYTIAVRVTDDDGSTDIAILTVTVNLVNHPPVAYDIPAATDEGTPVNITLSAYDPDGNDLTYGILLPPANGTLSGTAPDLTYTPNTGYSGTDSFTYKANDGTDDSNIATVTINVRFVNNPPVAVDDAYSTNENTTLDIADPSVLGNDSDADADLLTAILVDDVTDGTLTLNADGSFSYTPDTDYTGTDSFTYKANDGTDDSNIATVTINVRFVNNPPIAVDDAYSTNENATLDVADPGVLDNDSDADADPLTAILVDNVTDGTLTLNADGSFSYTPDTDYTGADSFTYKANDGNDNSSIATVTINVNSDNSAPVAHIGAIDDCTIPLPVTIKVTPQTLNLERLGNWVKVHIHDDTENTPQQMEVIIDGSNSFDPDGDPLTYDWMLIGPDGEIPVVDNVVSQLVTLAAGSYTVVLVVNDGILDSVAVSVSFTLTNITNAEVAATNMEQFTLNGVPASELKGGGPNIVLSFDDNAIADTVAVGLDVEMRLEGPVSGVDYIDVIQDKDAGDDKGKSNLK